MFRGSVCSGQSETAGELGQVLSGVEQTAIITASAASDICDALVSSRWRGVLSAADLSKSRCLPLLGNVALLQILQSAKKVHVDGAQSSERGVGKEALPQQTNLPPTRGPAPGASLAAQDRSPPWPTNRALIVNVCKALMLGRKRVTSASPCQTHE